MSWAYTKCGESKPRNIFWFFYFLIGVSFLLYVFPLKRHCLQRLARADVEQVIDPQSSAELSYAGTTRPTAFSIAVQARIAHQAWERFLAYRWPAFKKHLWAEVSRSTILLEWRKTVNQILWFSILYSTEVQWTQTQSQWIKRRTKAIHWEGLNLPYDPTYDPISLLLLNF